MADSDCVVVMGSNMAENHPVAFRWPMKAKVEHGAKIDSRRSALHPHQRGAPTSTRRFAPARDIAFLGGLINYVINSERWNKEPFFQDFVVNYTNAATIISEDFKDTEDLDGVFSGLMQYKGGVTEWPFNGFIGQYDGAELAVRRHQGRRAGRAARHARSPASTVGREQARRRAQRAGQRRLKAAGRVRRSTPLVASLLKPPPRRDETLQNPRCVFQIVKRHFAATRRRWSRATTGCPKETFLKVAETILANSGAGSDDVIRLRRGLDAAHERRADHRLLRAAAAAAGQHRPAGRRRHGAARPRLDPGLDGHSDALPLDPRLHGRTRRRSRSTTRSQDYLAAETMPTGYWANMPKFMVSYLKSMYGDAATQENQFGYDWHPKILGDHSHMAMFAAMNAGGVKGMFCIGQNPATSLNAKLERAALRKLEWLVVKDNWLTETANFWKNAPEVKNGEVKTADIKTEVFFFPATQVAEVEGTFTNTQRMLQFHHKAAEAPGDCRSDTWFYYELGKRLKKLYADSPPLPRDEGFKNLVWDYEHEDAKRAQEGRAFALKDPERDQRLLHRRSEPPLSPASAT